jgi:hypothetical protein
MPVKRNNSFHITILHILNGCLSENSTSRIAPKLQLRTVQNNSKRFAHNGRACNSPNEELKGLHQNIVQVTKPEMDKLD